MAATTIHVKASVAGVVATVRMFDHLRQAIRNKILRKSVSTGCVPQNKKAKATARFRDRTGMLRKSIGIKVRTYRKTASSIGVVGPRYGYTTTYRGKRVDPTKYSHIVEGGVFRRRQPPPFPRRFLEDAFNRSRSEAETRFANKFGIEVVAEAKKAGVP